MQDFISAHIVNHHSNIIYHQKGKTINTEQQKSHDRCFRQNQRVGNAKELRFKIKKKKLIHPTKRKIHIHLDALRIVPLLFSINGLDFYALVI